ncbi:Myb/SANT-like domain-containing protein [Dioscorea alata]|uniref:Myb/SANT-like domain-containing protein n=1 Tax=Dioscorea alata TaxID=55571 RepID=A0ACB7VR87_DIOAL|nr:Myb/SANT-like domain-containing protein [Dioscorea alata]
MTSFLLRCLVEQANLGLKIDKGFKSTAINAFAMAVSTRFNMVVSDTHVINRLRHVRKIWVIIKKLESLSGVSWDDSEKKIIMGIEEFRTYIQSHPSEAVYINKSIEDYEEMAIVCGNDQATGSFARTGSQSSRSLGVRMEMPSTPPMLDSNEQPQGLDDWDFTQSQPPSAETPTTSTSKTK